MADAPIRGSCLCGGIRFEVTAKPPIALAAGSALCALGHVRVVACAVGLAAFVAATATPWLGAGELRRKTKRTAAPYWKLLMNRRV